MALSYYEISVPVYQQFLRSLLGLMDKGEKHCAEKGIDEKELFAKKLADDMFPLSFQVVMSIQHSIGALMTLRGNQRERPTGIETFAAAKQAIESALSDLEAIEPAELADFADKPLDLPMPGGRELKFTGLGHLLSYGMPQFFFHVTTAYDILRHEGVPIGKRDYLGRIQLRK